MMRPELNDVMMAEGSGANARRELYKVLMLLCDLLEEIEGSADRALTYITNWCDLD